MTDLSLKQMQDLNLHGFFNDKEKEKHIQANLSLQSNLINEPIKKEDITLDDVLVRGGLFTYVLNKKKFKLNVLTKEDMNLLDNIDNLNEEGVIYDIQLPFKFHIRNSHDNYVTLKAQNYIEAQEVFDNLFGKGVYKASASKL